VSLLFVLRERPHEVSKRRIRMEKALAQPLLSTRGQARGAPRTGRGGFRQIYVELECFALGNAVTTHYDLSLFYRRTRETGTG